jgi:hypothetical protein
MSVLNLRKTPRVSGAHVMDMETEAVVIFPDCNEKHTLPTKVRIMLMLSMAVIPEERRAFRRKFCQASKKDEWNDREQKPCATSVSDVCAVPISWIAKAFKCEPFQLRCTGNMFPKSIMDVILNRAPKAAATDSDKETDYDVVRPVILYKEEDLGAKKDYLYRAVILFLSQCGKFYCHRERRKGDIGMPGTFTAHDMSWLRLQRTVMRWADGQFDVSYAFGKDSFVRLFFFETQGSLCFAMRSVVQMGGAFSTKTTASPPGGFPLGESTHPSITEFSTGPSSATIPMIQCCHQIHCRVRTVVSSFQTILLRSTDVFLRRRTAQRKTAVTMSVGVGTAGSRNLVGSLILSIPFFRYHG